jgi:glycosyltransferase involved in cell wall biosynthesis
MLDDNSVSTRPLKLVHLTTVDMSLGLLLATELEEDVKAGYETYGVSAPGPFVATVEALGVTHIPIPEFRRDWAIGSDIRAAVTLFRLWKSLKPDIVHCHTPKAGVLGRVTARLAGVPIVVNTCHGLWAAEEDPRLKRWLVYAAEVIAARFSHAELFQNPEDFSILKPWISRGPFHTSIVEVVGNGTDLEKFKFSEVDRDRVRAEMGVGAREVVILSVGRQVAEKGIEEFQQAAARLGQDSPRAASFFWAGPRELEKKDSASAEADAVTSLGMRSDMSAVYSAADVFVLASYREGFPRSAMEAAACSLPLVLTDIRGCREIGSNGVEVVFVKPRDADALSKAIKGLIDRADLRASMAEAARRRAVMCFDQRKIAKKSIATYFAINAALQKG